MLNCCVTNFDWFEQVGVFQRLWLKVLCERHCAYLVGRGAGKGECLMVTTPRQLLFNIKTAWVFILFWLLLVHNLSAIEANV